MVLYQDIAKAVTMVIKEAFPSVPIYGDEVREGYKTPSFFIGIIPVSSMNHTKNIKEEQLLITVFKINRCRYREFKRAGIKRIQYEG